MNRCRWVPCCAVVGGSIVVLSLIARAHENGGRATGERSVLSANWTLEATADARDFCRCVGETDLSARRRIEEALRGPLRSQGLDFVDARLELVVELLQEDYGVPVQLDTPALEEAGLGPEEPVTVNLHNISLRSALRLMLRPLDLTYVIQDEVLMITTPEEAETLLMTCVYDVRGLMVDVGDEAGKALIDAIISCVATETWAKNGGGEAETRFLKPGLLVVSQTHAVHEEIRELLAAIRDMRQRPAGVKAAADRASREPDPADDNPYD